MVLDYIPPQGEGGPEPWSCHQSLIRAMSPYVLTLTKHLHFTGLTNCCVVFCVHWCGLPYFLAGFVLLFIVLPLNANIGETAENCGEAGRQSTGCRADQRPVAGGAAVKWTPLGGRRGYLNNFSQPVRPAEPWYRPRHRSHRTALVYCTVMSWARLPAAV